MSALLLIAALVIVGVGSVTFRYVWDERRRARRERRGQRIDLFENRDD